MPKWNVPWHYQSDTVPSSSRVEQAGEQFGQPQSPMQALLPTPETLDWRRISRGISPPACITRSHPDQQNQRQLTALVNACLTGVSTKMMSNIAAIWNMEFGMR